MNSNIDDVVIPILRELQGKIAVLDERTAKFDERMEKMDIHLGIVKAHMTGFMSSAKYLEREIDELRGRVEALEQRDQSLSPGE